MSKLNELNEQCCINAVQEYKNGQITIDELLTFLYRILESYKNVSTWLIAHNYG